MTGPDRIIWSWGPGESRFGLFAGDSLLELSAHRPGMLRGWVFRGRVTAVDKALDAAFIDLGQGGPPGFLGGAKALGLAEGQAVAVRVKSDGVGAKGPKLVTASDHDLSGPVPAVLERPSPLELLLRAYPTVTDVLADDPVALAEARRLVPAARLDRDLDLDEAWEAALSPVVPLACGGRLIVETTAALTAVDVDSGPARPMDANREAVAELARQLRLRGIGGQIVVDFVSGPKGTPYKLAAALKKAVAADPTPTHVFGVSPLGLVELVRERVGPSLAETLCRRFSEQSAETLALSALRRLLREAEARPGARLRLVVAPELAACLERQADAVAETGRRLGRPLSLRSDPTRTRDDIAFEDDRP